MNKLEVGMYIRTNKGTIDKIDDKNIMMYEVSLMGFGEKPIKASHNIIDLIEVGDFVNGWKVTQITNSYVEICWGRDSDEFIKPENIKSVLTKEQFSSMEYRLGE